MALLAKVWLPSDGPVSWTLPSGVTLYRGQRPRSVTDARELEAWKRVSVAVVDVVRQPEPEPPPSPLARKTVARPPVEKIPEAPVADAPEPPSIPEPAQPEPKKRGRPKKKV